MRDAGFSKRWLLILGVIILVMTVAALIAIWKNVQDMEYTRCQELVDFAANVSETSDVFIKNKQYEDFYKIINLLTHIGYIRYIAVFLDGSKVIQAGDPTQADAKLMAGMLRNNRIVSMEKIHHRFYVNQRLAFHQEKSANVMVVFSLDEFQNSQRNIIFVSALILVLVLALGVTFYILVKVYDALAAVHSDLSRSHHDLSRVHKALEASEATKSHMIRAISHDSMHTLSAIYSTLYTLLDQPQDGGLPAQLGKDLKHIRENVHSIKRVFENLRDNERISKGNLKLYQKEIDLVYWLRFVVENYEVTLQHKQIEIETHIPAAPIMVLADKESIKSVMMNLLDNAVKYSPAKTRITLRVEQDGREVRVFLQDQGFGIPADCFEKIFEPFCRLLHSDQVIEGSGLGLSNAREQMRMHGGDLRVVESQVGLGTVFLMVLPNLQPSA